MATGTQRSTVVGVFTDRARAEEAVQELHNSGFTNDQIGFATRRGDTGAEPGAQGHGTEAGEGAAKGVVSGGIIGAILGALATGLIPGVGPVIAGGLLAGIIGGGVIGAAGGGLIGALGGSMGVPEEEARYYDQEFRSGRTIVTVKPDGRYDEAQSILRQYGAYDVNSQPGVATGTTTMQGNTGMPRTELDRGMQFREEELRVNKTPVQTGQIQVGKDVVEEERTLEVPVSREEVYVERHPVDRRPSDKPVTEREQTIEVPVREEHVEVEKQPVVFEEVGVAKRQSTAHQQVSETVRREEARIEKVGDVDVSGTETPRDARRG
ncbi:MAG: YsnF/AvaK domain-containing protein [Chloroflexi bacterium]|nr:YsnF/AvaK domain-containing protein [Chloroflexota bacterium]